MGEAATEACVRVGWARERVHKRMRACIGACARVEGRVWGVVHKRMRARISVCARVVVGCRGSA